MKCISQEVGYYVPAKHEAYSYKFLMYNKLENTNLDLKIIFIDLFDYSILKEINSSRCNIYYLLNKIIINTLNNKYFEINTNNLEITEIESNLIPRYIFKNDVTLYIDSLSKSYYLLDNGGKIEFEMNKLELDYRIILQGILEFNYYNKEKNWLRLIDPLTGNEKWKKDYEWEISDINVYNDVITLVYRDYSKFRSDEGFERERDWSNPIIYNIAIDADSGKELWRLQRPRWGLFYNIDKEWKSYLCMQVNEYNISYGRIESANVLELDLKTGNVITSVEVKPLERMGFEPKFADEEGIFYTNHYGSFGKIRRTDGIVLWEFDLIDEKGTKRKVLDFLKLGNGKFVLQTPPNHKNGDLTCIFDVDENIAEASVTDGVRVKENLNPSRG